MSEAVVMRYATKFKEAMTAGLDGLVKASSIYVEFIDKHPGMEASFRQECRSLVPDGIWVKMERVGRGKLHPRLMLGAFNNIGKTNAVARLPYKLQEQAVQGKVFDVVVNGEPVKATIAQASIDAVKRLCVSGGLRSVIQQIELEKVDLSQRKTVEHAWLLVNGGKGVRFVKKDVFTKNQLLKIAERMIE